MNPIFFGDSARPLFGLHHPPLAKHPAPRRVVLCPTLGQEAIRAHRAYRQLATQLARAGHHVLRFDYTGTGDSAGLAEEATLDVWRSDITAAAEELRDMGGPDALTLVGIRFGAALVAQADAVVGPRDVVLWDPVVRGQAYVDELLRIIGATAPALGEAGDVVGIGGVHVSRAMHDAMGALDLGTGLGSGVRRALVLLSREDPAADRLERGLTAGGATVTRQVVPMASDWDDADAFGGVLLPSESIRTIVAFING